MNSWKIQISQKSLNCLERCIRIVHLPQFQDLFLDLKGLVVGELDYVRDWSEEGLVDMDLGVGVNRIIANVEELNDIGFWELFDDAFA